MHYMINYTDYYSDKKTLRCSDCMQGHVTANLRNQLLQGIPNLFRESGESLKSIEIPQNL